MKENNLTEIKEVTLTVGEATGIVPKFFYDCWPAAIEDSDMISDCKLIINVVKGIGTCRNCDHQYVITDHHGKCPKCGSEDYDLQTGYEFEVTEIKAR